VSYAAKFRTVIDTHNRFIDGTATARDKAVLATLNRLACDARAPGTHRDQANVLHALRALMAAATMTIDFQSIRTKAAAPLSAPNQDPKYVSYVASAQIIEKCVLDGWFDESLADNTYLWYNTDTTVTTTAGIGCKRAIIRAGDWSKQVSLLPTQVDLATMLQSKPLRQFDFGLRLELYDDSALSHFLSAMRAMEKGLNEVTDRLFWMIDGVFCGVEDDDAMKTLGTMKIVFDAAEALDRLPLADENTRRSMKLSDNFTGVRWQLVSNVKHAPLGDRTTNSSTGNVHLRSVPDELCDALTLQFGTKFTFPFIRVQAILYGAHTSGFPDIANAFPLLSGIAGVIFPGQGEAPPLPNQTLIDEHIDELVDERHDGAVRPCGYIEEGLDDSLYQIQREVKSIQEYIENCDDWSDTLQETARVQVGRGANGRNTAHSKERAWRRMVNEFADQLITKLDLAHVFTTDTHGLMALTGTGGVGIRPTDLAHAAYTDAVREKTAKLLDWTPTIVAEQADCAAGMTKLLDAANDSISLLFNLKREEESKRAEKKRKDDENAAADLAVGQVPPPLT